jgi:hypothetical protein
MIIFHENRKSRAKNMRDEEECKKFRSLFQISMIFLQYILKIIFFELKY